MLYLIFNIADYQNYKYTYINEQFLLALLIKAYKWAFREFKWSNEIYNLYQGLTPYNIR